MHILATFATLCCQTRWPRNHSCTTQEHVSFFRTFSGHFRKSRLFRHFDTFCEILTFYAKTWKNDFHTCAHFWKIEFTNAQLVQKLFTRVKQFCKCAKDKCANVQMCKKPTCTKCANLQRKLFSKCRNCNSHKSANAHFTIRAKHISAEQTFSLMQISVCELISA